jgi:hypothetical protein
MTMLDTPPHTVSSNPDRPIPDAVTAALKYLVDTGERPVTRMAESGDEESQCSGTYAPYDVRIHNARALAPAATLDREGFELRRHDTAVEDFYDDEEVRAVYYPEMECFVRRVTGATRVVMFDHNTRTEGEVRARHANARGPAHLVHNDLTAWAAPRRVRGLLPAAEAEALLAGRVASINVWRPIRGPMERSPLALCDARSVVSWDLVASDMVYQHRRGEEFRCIFSPHHRWYYFPRLRREEAVLIKIYDSAEDGSARFTLHSAFDDPTSPANAAPRESIEVRTFAFFGPPPSTASEAG